MANEFRKVKDANGVFHPVCDDTRVAWTDAGKSVQKNIWKLDGMSKTGTGISFTLNADKTVSMSSGTATDENYFPSNIRFYAGGKIKPNTKYTVSYGDAPIANLRIQAFYKETSSSSYTQLLNDTTHSSAEFTTPASFYEVWIRLSIVAGATVTANTLYPMIKESVILDNTWAPPIPDNTELITWEANGVLGAKNLLNYNRKENNTEATITIDEDGVIDVNGTVTTEGSVIGNATFDLPAGNYILSGCTGGSTSTYCLDIYENQWNNRVICEDGDVPFTFNSDTGHIIRIYLKADTYNHVKFKPMIRLASDGDPTYQPHAMTNRELTEKVSDTITSTFTLNDDGTDIVKNGNIVHFIVRIDSLTATDGDTIATLPTGFRPPSKTTWFTGMNIADGSCFPCYVGNDGKLVIRKTLSNASIRITGTFII